MRLGKFAKTPDEVKRYSINYEHWLDVDEYVSDVSFATVSENEGLLNLFPNSLAETATGVDFFVSGGADGETYRVSVTITTSANQIKQDTILYSVKAP